jgi:hypothetical protein
MWVKGKGGGLVAVSALSFHTSEKPGESGFQQKKRNGSVDLDFQLMFAIAIEGKAFGNLKWLWNTGL